MKFDIARGGMNKEKDLFDVDMVRTLERLCKSSYFEILDPQDLISDLPKDLIHRIMGCLPLKVAARMSTLSKVWRQNWLTLPSLVLDGKFFRDVLRDKRNNVLQYSRIVSNILLQHHGRPIAKFTLHIPSHIEQEPDILQWISFLSINDIKELRLNNCKHHTSLKLPSHFFAYNKYTKLKLDFFTFNPPPSFKGFPYLISIYLVNIFFPSDDVFANFVAKCPLLEELKLKYGFDQPPHLVINAPNLKYLTIHCDFQSIRLNGSPSLLSVSITLRKWVTQLPSKERTRELIKFLASSCKVEKLCFRRFFVKLLVEGGVSRMLPVAFTHVRNLLLTCINSCKELSCAIGIIRSCPNVEILHISVKITEGSADTTIEDNLSPDLTFKFYQLRNIDVKLNSGSIEELKLIKFLLTCSPVLETFNLEIREELNADAKLKISMILKQLHITSSKIISFFFMTNKGHCAETSRSNSNSNSDLSGYSTSDDDE